MSRDLAVPKQIDLSETEPISGAVAEISIRVSIIFNYLNNQILLLLPKKDKAQFSDLSVRGARDVG